MCLRLAVAGYADKGLSQHIAPLSDRMNHGLIDKGLHVHYFEHGSM